MQNRGEILPSVFTTPKQYVQLTQVSTFLQSRVQDCTRLGYEMPVLVAAMGCSWGLFQFKPTLIFSLEQLVLILPVTNYLKGKLFETQSEKITSKALEVWFAYFLLSLHDAKAFVFLHGKIAITCGCCLISSSSGQIYVQVFYYYYFLSCFALF